MTDSEKTQTKLFQAKNITWPIILILCGILLLFNNLGILSWDVWNVIFRFWPVLLILAGVEYILGNSLLGSLFSFLITIAVLLFIFAYSVSIISRPFDQYLRMTFPFWSNLKRNIPESRLRNLPFRCYPFEEDCQMYYRWN
ncbi:MAG: hypothetical protein US62_C0001G0028 [Candidatus Woesebacteria bacterium GW2011_GWA1_37_8]|uniref:LiaI-LiaF-like transmembrane region domain-containing protein n=2 Tax=Candidatus Woeseibacteriota TaxID=1752722 RepID=A0A0G0L9V5_9BACT|nr:MAG: hypothetical protein US62_C0001G0028 [Candidatus Woesebacteria bacterium GW2011_GWA1_37_8]KKQ87787.1 MAG: hypothetical protein UT10_C0001G0028 [Candidatus Woesebacteria bacterium GW2011_GWB1_38_8b]